MSAKWPIQKNFRLTLFSSDSLLWFWRNVLAPSQGLSFRTQLIGFFYFILFYFFGRGSRFIKWLEPKSQKTVWLFKKTANKCTICWWMSLPGLPGMLYFVDQKHELYEITSLKNAICKRNLRNVAHGDLKCFFHGIDIAVSKGATCTLFFFLR